MSSGPRDRLAGFRDVDGGVGAALIDAHPALDDDAEATVVHRANLARAIDKAIATRVVDVLLPMVAKLTALDAELKAVKGIAKLAANERDELAEMFHVEPPK